MSGHSRDGTQNPFGKVNTAHYPDLVAAGGLVGALRAEAEACDIDVGVIGTRSKAQWAGYTSAMIDTGRGTVFVNIGVAERLFSVDIAQDAIQVAQGVTPELANVVGVAAAWRAGASHDVLTSRYPFMQVSRLAKVLASANPVAAQWDWLLDDPEFSDDRELLLALAGNDTIRGLFPDMSHRSVRLSRSFEERGRAVVFSEMSGQRYRVEYPGPPTSVTEYETMPDAVAALVDSIRRGCV
jgi:Family of unknown function (DUF6193)